MLVQRLVQARIPSTHRINFLANSFIRYNSTQQDKPPIQAQAVKHEQSQPQSQPQTEASRPSWANPSPAVASKLTCQSQPLKNQPFYAPYLALTKPRLTALVVISAMCPYALSPDTATLSQLMFLTIGTALASGSANAINMGREYKFDALMTRTKTRPVVRGVVSDKQAFTFATVAGSVGVASLYFGVNPTVAALGAANIALYGGLYTTLKRKHIVNTWVGAIVGSIPPLMGWAAASSLQEPGAWLLAALLYAWQFPHFMSLSHNIRDEYRRAGYVMACWKNPALNARVALRYSLAMFPICVGLSYYGLCDPYFILDSSLINGWMTYGAWKFWKEWRKVSKPVFEAGSTKNARILFWASVWHLPAIFMLALLHKKGQWDWLFGSSDDDQEEPL